MLQVVERSGKFVGHLTPATRGAKGDIFFGPDEAYLDKEEDFNGYLVAKALQIVEGLGLPVRYDSHLEVDGANGHLTKISLDHQEIKF